MKAFFWGLATAMWLVSPAWAREVRSLDAGWSFFQGDAPGAEKPDFDSSGWRVVRVPHDWSIAGSFEKSAPTTGSGGWLPSGVAWYRKSLDLPEDLGGRRVWVEFDGVMANSRVWLNGDLLGERPNGYVSFRHDLTDRLKSANVLVVKADTSAQPASRWYTGAGIYRHVRLVIADPVHVAPWGVFVSTPVADESNATVKVATSVINGGGEDREITIKSAVLGPDGKQVAAAESALSVAAGKTGELVQDIAVPEPALWDVESPHLHQLVTTLFVAGKAVDEVRTPFGIRTAEFTTDRGFVLNGKRVKLKGVCLHHDGGAVGAAVPLGVWERRLSKLRELGVNAIRTAHNPVAPEFLDLCDRRGFLVMDEFFDCWTKGKNRHDYHLHFKKWAHTDLRDGILRDRNHPSVVLYSVGNEIHDTPKPDLAKPILKGLVDVCHATDPTRPVTQALFRPNVSGDFTNGLADLLDVIGVNYRDAELLQAWKDKPGRKIVGTEQGHDRSTWLECRDHPQHAGQFLWVGIDYLGEARTWPVTTFNAGLLDRAGFVQPRGVERRSWWSEKPMVGVFRRLAATEATPADPGYEAVEWKRRQVLFPDWTPADRGPHRENVEVYSNAAEVELFLNGESLGKRATRKDAGALNWKVDFAPGTLEAVAFTDGKEVARDTLCTAGEPAKIVLSADRSDLTVGWDQVAHVELRVVDQAGTVVPSASNKIHFAVEGPGAVIGVDNGSIVSHERFQSMDRHAFQGRALAILRRGQGEGEIVLKATADGLEGASVTFH
ncbi:glycoside hydrolase family 2 TIM barrel-domain containing protein [Luteolibacter marinus]|uniref:glycoside hydrolase family 2 TIM barrel-domain containing protein n=1 Tax=Luteolibacter marinus TaxID=2776705 RepID=UPI001D02EC6B|nr:glycoside hydrolase family 2 TIM barrel-domain containing protein [Luteolibacter marinus]